MAVLVNSIIVGTKLMSPALVETKDKVFDIFGLSESQKGYELVYEFCPFAGNKVTKGDPLFPRLDSKTETEFIQSLTK